MQTPLQSSPKGSSQLEGEHIKKDKGKRAISLDEAKKVSTNSDSDDETHVTGSMVETSKIKKLKKFDFITEDGKHIHLTEEQINQQKKIEEEAKAEVAKQEGEVKKAELVDLLGAEVVKKYYNDKLQKTSQCHQGFAGLIMPDLQLPYLLAKVDKEKPNPTQASRVIEPAEAVE
ncbi:hypothetical protein Tco_0640512 [Tanacetum coccineum]